MLHLFQRWLVGPRSPTWDLSGYPCFELPHPGSGHALTEVQAQQNWAYWQRVLAERRHAVRNWLLAHQGPDAEALSAVSYAKALNAWAKVHWSKLPAFSSLPRHRPWPDCPRGGPFIVYSLLGDLSLSLGEAIRAANGHWHWGLSWDPTDLADGMYSSRRVVLLAELKRPTPETREAVLDLEAMVFAAYRFPDAPDFVYRDVWSEAVAEAVAGRHYDP